MRTSDFGERRGESGLVKKLEHEAAAWRRRRVARPHVSTRGVQVVRIPKRRVSRAAVETGVTRP